MQSTEKITCCGKNFRSSILDGRCRRCFSRALAEPGEYEMIRVLRSIFAPLIRSPTANFPQILIYPNSVPLPPIFQNFFCNTHVFLKVSTRFFNALGLSVLGIASFLLRYISSVLKMTCYRTRSFNVNQSLATAAMYTSQDGCGGL